MSRVGKAEVRCAQCKRPVPKRLAAYFQGKPLHPINCFPRYFERAKHEIDATIARAVRGVS